RRGLVPVLGSGRADRQDGLAEALRRTRHLRRDPAQGRHAGLERDRRDQQGPERTDLRVRRPRRGGRPAPDRAQAGRARPRPQIVTVRPSDYPPPWSPSEAIQPPTDPADERIEVGFLIVGAGPAGLAAAIRLGQLLEEDPATAERLGDVPVAVLEKGKAPGSHLLSGAVVNPRGLPLLFRDRKRIDELPLVGEVEAESVLFLTKRHAYRIPTPPTMVNDRNYVASLSQFGRF